MRSPDVDTTQRVERVCDLSSKCEGSGRGAFTLRVPTPSVGHTFKTQTLCSRTPNAPFQQPTLHQSLNDMRAMIKDSKRANEATRRGLGKEARIASKIESR